LVWGGKKKKKSTTRSLQKALEKKAGQSYGKRGEWREGRWK